MLQIGRFLCRGQGAILVMGPLGAALVPLSLADGAADVVWGRADTQTWLAQVQADGDSALLLDCAGEQPYLTVLGAIQLRMRSAGQIAEQVWTDPIWAWPFNPGEWQTFEAAIVDGDEVTWMVPAADRVEAGEIRIGRSLDELEALASLPVDTMGFLIHSTETPTQRPVAVVPESPKDDEAYDVAAAEAKFLATLNKDERASAPAAESLAVVAEQVVATMPSDDSSATRISRERPRHAADSAEDGAAPGQGQEAPSEQGTGSEKGAGTGQGAGTDSAPPADSAPQGPAPAGTDEEDSMARTLVDQPPVARPPATRPPAARPPVATAPPPAEDSYEEIAPDVLAGMNAEATQARRAPHNVGPSAPVAFLIHGGTVPVEVSRDVIIGRDPDARALTGRPVATVLRVPSPATEISRSHCAVMMTAPGAWSLMDLGSANGTILRHADGSFQDVTPMVTIALNDGDLIDVGEGTTIEFRVR